MSLILILLIYTDYSHAYFGSLDEWEAEQVLNEVCKKELPWFEYDENGNLVKGLEDANDDIKSLCEVVKLEKTSKIEKLNKIFTDCGINKQTSGCQIDFEQKAIQSSNFEIVEKNNQDRTKILTSCKIYCDKIMNHFMTFAQGLDLAYKKMKTFYLGKVDDCIPGVNSTEVMKESIKTDKDTSSVIKTISN